MTREEALELAVKAWGDGAMKAEAAAKARAVLGVPPEEPEEPEEQAMVRVWEVSGPCVSGDADSIVTDNREAAGRLAVEAAELAWDDGGSEVRPGPRISVYCYEMSRADYAALCGEEE